MRAWKPSNHSNGFSLFYLNFIDSPYHDVSGLPEQYTDQMDHHGDDQSRQMSQHSMPLNYDDNVVENEYTLSNSRNRRVIHEIIVWDTPRVRFAVTDNNQQLQQQQHNLIIPTSTLTTTTTTTSSACLWRGNQPLATDIIIEEPEFEETPNHTYNKYK